MDSTLVRVLYVILTLVPGLVPRLLVYLNLALVMDRWERSALGRDTPNLACMPTTWVKSANEAVVSGVLAGFARDWGIHPWLLRTIYVVVTLATLVVPGVLIYLLLSLAMK